MIFVLNTAFGVTCRFVAVCVLADRRAVSHGLDDDAFVIRARVRIHSSRWSSVHWRLASVGLVGWRRRVDSWSRHARHRRLSRNGLVLSPRDWRRRHGRLMRVLSRLSLVLLRGILPGLLLELSGLLLVLPGLLLVLPRLLWVLAWLLGVLLIWRILAVGSIGRGIVVDGGDRGRGLL